MMMNVRKKGNFILVTGSNVITNLAKPNAIALLNSQFGVDFVYIAEEGNLLISETGKNIPG